MRIAANQRRSEEVPPIWRLATRAYFHSMRLMSSALRGGSGMPERLLAWLQPREDEMAALLAELVNVPTENPPGRNYRACADLLEEKLYQAGLTCERQEFPAPTASARTNGQASASVSAGFRAVALQR